MSALAPAIARGLDLQRRMRVRAHAASLKAAAISAAAKAPLGSSAPAAWSAAGGAAPAAAAAATAVESKQEEFDEDSATWLLTRKRQVDEMNAKQLNQLPGSPVVFTATDEGTHKGHVGQLDRACPARQRIELKPGAQVMLLKNLNVNAGLCNGTRGVIIRFGADGYPVVFFPGIKQTLPVQAEVWPLRVSSGDGMLRRITSVRFSPPFFLNAYSDILHSPRSEV